MRIDDLALIRDIAAMERDDIVTLYLPVDPTDPRNQRSAENEWWRSKAKALLSELEIGDGRADRMAFREIIDNLTTFADQYVPDELSLVVFASPDDVVTIPLQVTVEPEAAIGRPVIGPLVKAVTMHRRYLIMLVAADEQKAVEAQLGEVDHVVSLRLGQNWGMPGPSRSAHRFRFEAHREKHQRRYQKGIAEELDRLVLSGEFDRVILGGAEREAHGVLASMNEKAAEHVAGIVPIPLDATDHDIASRAQPLAVEYEDAHEEATIRRILRKWHGSGTAAVGLASVQQVLSMHVVRRLVIARGALDEQVREEAIRQALAQGAHVLFVFGTAAELLSEHEGIAAELYYNPF